MHRFSDEPEGQSGEKVVLRNAEFYKMEEAR